MAKKTAAASRKTAPAAPWKRKRPEGASKTTLTPASKAKARKRARDAGRKYPNLVDNMRAAVEQRSRKTSVKKKAATKKAAKKKVPSRE